MLGKQRRQWRRQGEQEAQPPVLQTKHKHMFELHLICQLDEFILGKIIVSIRSHLIKLTCTKFDFGWGSAETPLGELTALPQTSLAGF